MSRAALAMTLARVSTTRATCARVTRDVRASSRAVRTRANGGDDGDAPAPTLRTGANVPLADAAMGVLALAMDVDRLGRITLTGAPADARDRRVEFQWVTIRGEPRLQRTRYDARQAFASNHAVDERVSGRGGKETVSARVAVVEALDAGYKHWRVEHESGGWNVTANAKKSRATVSRDKMKLIDGNSATSATFFIGPRSHDREKARLVTGDDPFLRHVGVIAEDGRVKASKRDKYKQVEEFLKILDRAVEEATSANHMDSASDDRPLRVCDLGCGNAYLTFGAFSVLTTKRNIPTTVVGVDVKRQAREHNKKVATELGWQDSMRFVEGTIANAEVSFGNGQGAPDVVLALHACDTATDESIVRTVRWRAPLALIAPCCHHDLQTRLKKSTTVAFPPLARHGILSERFGDVLTDAFRAHILRLLGYRVDVMEFVGGEHTPRNTLIRAIRTNALAARELWEEYDGMVQTWGVEPFLAEELRHELDEARARSCA